MRRRLYPEAQYPQGHRDLALSLNNLGELLQDQGEYAGARDYYEQALAMRRRLYPEAQYPQGHRDLAQSLNNLGTLLQGQGEYAGARDCYERALAMRRRLYPEAQYPQGHPHLALSLNNLGELLQGQGEYAGARDCYERALAMRRRLYPEAQYPQGHPHLALSLNNLGGLLQDQGEYAGARDYHERALAMLQRLYPEAQYPQGHRDLAQSLNNLGALLWAQGEYAGARDYCERALAMYQSVADDFTAAASEAEALNFAAPLPMSRDGLLSAARHLPDSDEAAYAAVWRTKAAVMRIVQRRQMLLRTATADPKVQDLVKQWEQARRDLSRLLLDSASGRPGQGQRVQEATRHKEELERKLAELGPEFRRQPALRELSLRDLMQKLPQGTVFIDLVQYIRFDQDLEVKGLAGERRSPCYVAFVLAPGRPVARRGGGGLRRSTTRWPPGSPPSIRAATTGRPGPRPRRCAGWSGTGSPPTSRPTPTRSSWRPTRCWPGCPGRRCRPPRADRCCWSGTPWRSSPTAPTCWSG